MQQAAFYLHLNPLRKPLEQLVYLDTGRRLVFCLKSVKCDTYFKYLPDKIMPEVVLRFPEGRYEGRCQEFISSIDLTSSILCKNSITACESNTAS